MVTTGGAGRLDRHLPGTQRTCREGPVHPARDEAIDPAILGPDRSALAWRIAQSVPDPELPMLTLADLGILRDVSVEGSRIVVSITPTYSGCPAMAEMRADVYARLAGAGVGDVEVRTVLSPPWSTDWITAEGRRKLAAAGIAPPELRDAVRPAGPVPLTLTTAPERSVMCPACGSAQEDSAFLGSGQARPWIPRLRPFRGCQRWRSNR